MTLEPSASIPHLLKKIDDKMKTSADRELHALNLTFAQMHVLIYLMIETENHEAPLKQIEKRFEVAQATMAGIVSRLEAKGFVKGDVDPHDHRRKIVRLTPQGLDFLEHHREEMNKRDRELLSCLSEEEQQELIRLLNILYKKLSED